MGVRIQPINMPLAIVPGDGGRDLSIYITPEWRRPLEQMAALVNAQAAEIAALRARLAAAGIP